ncbi:uncharacterized protein LOC123407441 isoform X2 [Hordeum vulgare subsp. vulgare]|uniref:uncharacterized protein LOC123407441 isoform X2 n=1 Tax=Hordeum vulgare subsp. vulgare TaxID=112509 RepID=UPI00162EABC4|nr:uncharacterized protein LOC123407441 isoform X2 [Hordeum vulgare subsp. vulgare]KAI4969099.1 hypothetical protein ZWY2020_000013 [Hordeum vulgare]
MADGEGWREERRRLYKAIEALVRKTNQDVERLLADRTYLETLLVTHELIWADIYSALNDRYSALRDCLGELLAGKDIQARHHQIYNGHQDGGLEDAAALAQENNEFKERATKIARKLQHKVEELQLQVVAQNKDDHIGRLQAEANDAKMKMLAMEEKLEKMHSLITEKDDEIQKLKSQDINGTHRKSRSEGSSVRAESEGNPRRQDQPETSQNGQKTAASNNGGLENEQVKRPGSRYTGRTIITYNRGKMPTKPVLVNNSSSGSDDKDDDHEPPGVGGTVVVGDSPRSASVEIGKKTAFVLGNGGSSSYRNVDDDDLAPMGSEGMLRRSARKRRTPQPCRCCIMSN